MNLEPLLSFPKRGRYEVIGEAGGRAAWRQAGRGGCGGRRDVPCESAGTSKRLTYSQANSEFERWADSYEKQATDYITFFNLKNLAVSFITKTFLRPNGMVFSSYTWLLSLQISLLDRLGSHC